jgi:hypothetical protein
MRMPARPSRMARTESNGTPEALLTVALLQRNLVLHDYLHWQYMEVLSLIGRLTDAEAESVELAFTRFEGALVGLDQERAETSSKAV